MKTIHMISFPHYQDHVFLERRTLFHMPIDEQPWAIGDDLRLLAAPNFPRCKVGVLTDVRQVRLLAELDADLAKLCVANRAEYLARWDALHPKLPAAADPMVWRIEFRYGVSESDPPESDPPEWSLAS
jgi:hypothetical protein